MRILLVRPPVKKSEAYNIIPPLGLGYLATALRRIGIEVDILDCSKKNFSFSQFIGYVKRLSPRLVGFQTYSHSLWSVKRSIGLVKRLSPSIYTVIGGPHPSGLPLESLNQIPEVDFGFKGEAEVGFPMLIKLMLDNKRLSHERLVEIPGLIWRNKKNIVANFQSFPDPLDELGFPSWDLINPKTYPCAPQGGIFRRFPFAPIIATRGCSYDCSFCAGHTITGKRLRRRSIENIIEEIIFLSEAYGVKEFHFLDDNLTFKQDYIQGLCQKIIVRGLKFNWCCPNGLRLDSFDEETLRLMKQAGCYYISVGIESGSPRILKNQKKGLTIEQIKRKVALIRKVGFDVAGFFMIGYPQETEKDIETTIRFSRGLGLSRAAFFSFLPLPGSSIYEDLVCRNEIKDFCWNNLLQNRIAYTPSGISRRRLKKLQQKAYLLFYLRPRIIYKLIKEIKILAQLRYILRRLLNIII